MKNYLDQQIELKVALIRINSLKNKRELYFQRTQPKATEIKDTIVTSSNTSDSFFEYVCSIEELDKKISLIQSEIDVLNDGIKKMENELKGSKNKTWKIFVARYIDCLEPKEIANKMNYSLSHVYRKLTEINEILKKDKK